MAANLFYKNLKLLRRQKKLTQEEIGEILGIKRSTYAHLEAYGKRIVITPELKRLIAEFGYSIEELLTTDLSETQLNKTREISLENTLPPSTSQYVKEIDEMLLMIEEMAVKLKKIKQNLTTT